MEQTTPNPPQAAHVVLCHPEPTSFTADWARASLAALQDAGASATFSDLHAMRFDPVERREHHPGAPAPFDPLKAQEHAAATRLPRDVEGEVCSIERAETLILHFPMWWFAPPGMLKGWCDRVLVHGRMHAVGARFDRGPCRGKTALMCVSTGGTDAEHGPRGKEGRIELLLWPLAYTLRYCGFDIAAPEVAHGVHGYWTGDAKAGLEVRLKSLLERQSDLLSRLGDRPRWCFNSDSDYRKDGRLKPGVEPEWPFQS